MSKILGAVLLVCECAAAILVSLAGCVTLASAADAVKLDDIISVWRKREEATRSLRIEMASDYLMVKGPPKAIPPNKERWLVAIDGIKMRYERVGEVWTEQIQANAPDTMIAVFDGSTTKALHKRERADDILHSQGWIFKQTKHQDAENVYLSPIIRHFRPLSPTFDAIQFDKLQLADADDPVDGIACARLEETHPNGKVIRYWVALDQQMSIVRWAGTINGNPSARLEASFKRDAALGWIPNRWSVTRLANEGKTVLDSATTSVTKAEINIRIPGEDFDMVFPTGTEVFDRVEEKTYIMKSDAVRREVLPSEQRRGATYSELAQTTPGNAAREQDTGGSASMTIVLAALLVLAIAGVAVLVFKRRNWSAG